MSHRSERGVGADSGRRLLLAKVAHHPPVGLRHSEPLTVPRADVDVDRTEVVVLLVTCRRRRGIKVGEGGGLN